MKPRPLRKRLRRIWASKRLRDRLLILSAGALASASGGSPAGVGHTGVTGMSPTGRGVPSGVAAWPCWSAAMSSSLGYRPDSQ